MQLTLDSIIVRTGGLMSTPMDREVVILNPMRDNYTALDEVGRRVWELLAVPNKVRSLCLQVTREFQGDPRQIEADILTFLDELAADGLLGVTKE